MNMHLMQALHSTRLSSARLINMENAQELSVADKMSNLSVTGHTFAFRSILAGFLQEICGIETRHNSID